MQIDISPALRKQEHEIVKSLIKHAVSKHCHFTRDIKILAQNVHSGQLISDIELSILKYELEMAIENVVETDPEIQPLLQKNFPPFQDERDSPVDADRNLNVTDNADSSPQLSQQDNNLVGNAAEDVQPVHSANTINKTFESGSVTPSETAPVNRVHASGGNRQVQVTDPIGTVYSVQHSVSHSVAQSSVPTSLHIPDNVQERPQYLPHHQTPMPTPSHSAQPKRNFTFKSKTSTPSYVSFLNFPL